VIDAIDCDETKVLGSAFSVCSGRLARAFVWGSCAQGVSGPASCSRCESVRSLVLRWAWSGERGWSISHAYCTFGVGTLLACHTILFG